MALPVRRVHDHDADRMRGLLKIAFKLLVNDRGKFFALLIGITFAVFLMVMMTSVFAGIMDIVMAVRLRSVIEHEWLLGLEGALSVAFGVLLFLAPLAGAVVLGLWVGAYALIFGGMLVEAGLRLRSYTHTVHEIEGTIAHAH